MDGVDAGNTSSDAEKGQNGPVSSRARRANDGAKELNKNAKETVGRSHLVASGSATLAANVGGWVDTTPTVEERDFGGWDGSKMFRGHDSSTLNGRSDKHIRRLVVE